MKRILVFLATILASFSLFSAVASASVMATGEKDGSGNANMCKTGSFLGFVPWYRGLTKKINGKCEIATPEVSSSDEGNGLTKMIVSIILNIAVDLSLAVGYLATGFVIYGGYLYIMAGGDPGKVAKGKKTLTAAIIGVAIAISANVIMNLIVGTLTAS